MTRRSRTAAAVLAAAALAGPAGAPAHARERPRGEVCAARVSLYDTPRGIVVGFLGDGARVVVLRRADHGRWTRVRSTRRITGWLRTRALCG